MIVGQFATNQVRGMDNFSHENRPKQGERTAAVSQKWSG